MNTTDQPGQAPTNDTLPAEQLKQAVERMARTLEYCEQPPANQLASVFTSDLRLVLSRLAELERDRERLDWLENNRKYVTPSTRDGPEDDTPILGWIVEDEGIEHDRPTARAAIDAAMTTPNTKGEAE